PRSSSRRRRTLPAQLTPPALAPVNPARHYPAYHAASPTAGSVLTPHRLMTLYTSEIVADRRQDVAAFLKVVAVDSAQQLTLETSASIDSMAAGDLTAAQLHRLGYDALQAG